MTITSFEEIYAWQKARVLTTQVYEVFRGNKDYSFKDQIQRASASIGNNIAEGFERKGNKEFSRFLYIAKGSAGEVRTILYTALDLNYISEAQFKELFLMVVEVSKLLTGLIKSLK